MGTASGVISRQKNLITLAFGIPGRAEATWRKAAETFKVDLNEES
jgi:hypothetical protein